MNKVLIIGGVAAGATAAARIRRLNGDVEITLLESGPDVSFANCGLPYYIGGEVEHRSSLILASPETFRDQYRVQVELHTEALKINRRKKKVSAVNRHTGRKRDYSYDVLILAQGGKPVIPGLPGIEMEHVFQLWTLQDMDAIHGFIESRQPKTAVVVGGGFIGLEMVEALVHRGIKVRLVEMAGQIMPNLEAEFAGFLSKQLQDHGVELNMKSALSSIEAGSVLLNDGRKLPADMVILSIGVRPTLNLVKDAGFDIGEAGGLLVNDKLQTSDPAVFAAGDMVELEHRILGKKVRIPLAGPANRQGRIAAENALGGARKYKGSIGTSILKLFDAAAGSTGVSLSAARDAGIDADAVVVHKLSHTAYYPGAEKVSLMLVYDRSSGRIIGAQAAGKVGVDKRLDVMATAIAGRLTLEDLAELDLAYAPPFNSPNGPVNMAAFTAQNKQDGFSPMLLSSEFLSFTEQNDPLIIDLRDPISFRNAHVAGSINLSQNMLRERMSEISPDTAVLLISDDGQKGHVSLRMMKAAGFSRVFNLAGGYISLERFSRILSLRGEQPLAELFPIDSRDAAAEMNAGRSGGSSGESSESIEESAEKDLQAALAASEPLVIDVRTIEEFSYGAYPGAIHIALDELPGRIDELGDRDRKLILYCASGARSAYGVRLLQKLGFVRAENGGGLHDMMSK
ncbi:FAD-dependent oxidoreductase [Spirochaeta dissipatitropha]